MSLFNQDKNKYDHKIIYLYRHINDIILLYNGNSRQNKQPYQYINNLHTKLYFRLETEVKNSINFFDCTIRKTNNRHVYRKPNTTVNVTNITTNHPTQHNHAAFHSMINRLLNIPFNQTDYNTKVYTIKYIGQENDYDLQPLILQ